MLPFLTIFGRDIPLFYVMGVFGLVCATYVAGFRARRYKLSRTDTVYIASFAMIGILIGGVLLFGITQIPSMWQNRAFLTSHPIAFLIRHFGGLVFYGGLFGAFLALVIYAKYMGIPLGHILSLTIPVFPLAHAIMRIGCFAGGCCYGIPFPPPLGIAFSASLGAPNGIPLLPVQLYEAAVNLCIFFILWRFSARDRDWKSIACLYALLYSFARFWLEFLRGDPARGLAFGLSTSQWISLALFAVCLTWTLLKQRKNRLN